MSKTTTDKLYVDLSASQVRKRVKGHGCGVKRVEDTSGQARTGFAHGEVEQARSAYKNIIEETTHYEKLNDQILQTQQDVMSLGTGERFVRIGGEIGSQVVHEVRQRLLVDVHPVHGVAGVVLQNGERTPLVHDQRLGLFSAAAGRGAK